MTLVHLEANGKITTNKWENVPESCDKECALSKNRVIMRCKPNIKIFDFSSKEIFTIPNSIYQFASKPIYLKNVLVVNENEIIVQIKSSLYKILLLKDLRKEENFVVTQMVELESLMKKHRVKAKENSPCYGPICLDLSHQCLWIPTNGENKSNGILRIDLNDFSSHTFYSNGLKEIAGGEIKTKGNILFRLAGRIKQAWEIKADSLKYLQPLGNYFNFTFNKEMTAFSFSKNSLNQKLCYRDYLEES